MPFDLDSGLADVYPINLAFLDGRVSEESLKEEHELAYEQLKKQAAQEEA